MEFLDLHSLAFGGGMRAKLAWTSGSPLVLVEILDIDGASHKARLDLNKHVFIDPLPGEPAAGGIRLVVDAVLKEHHLN